MSAAPTTPLRPFLERVEVTEAIEYLASAPSLSIVTGTGTSAEMGFPMWDELVRRLLMLSVATDSHLKSEQDKADFASALLRQGAIAGASYAQALLGDKADQVLGTALYEGVTAHAQVGEAALAVARLHHAGGSGGELVTLNYDMQLEQALSVLGVTAKPVRSGRKRSAGEVVVRHLHGTLPVKGGGGEDIVLGEAQYFDQGKKKWQEEFMARLLDEPVLFVGTSLNDPNLLRYLYTNRKETHPRHRAIFTVAQEERDFGGSQRSFEGAVNKRWRAAGVLPLHGDYYAQTVQFLHEVRQRQVQGSAYAPYKDRLDRWDSDMSADLHDFSDAAAFEVRQREIRDRLVEATDTLRERVRDRGLRLGPGERLGLELWSRKPSGRRLLRVGSSAIVWSDPQSLVSGTIARDAEQPVVKAFMAGQGRLLDCSGDQASPWLSLLALPIVLDDHPDYGRLPVGVLAVCSTVPLAESVLHDLRTEAGDIDAYLIGKVGEPGLAQALLDPTNYSASAGI